MLFFCKQNTAYELRISDWSSVVCSSYLAGFHDFGIGQPAVGHVRLDHTGAVEAGTRARAAGDRLIILAGVIAEGEIVHRALRGGHRAEGGEQRVGDDLARLDIARDDRSEEHTSELQSLMRISYAVFCLKKKKKRKRNGIHDDT